ncbi:MAG TPA: pectate lyase, partial [Pyrinomonadaceae bacterium]
MKRARGFAVISFLGALICLQSEGAAPHDWRLDAVRAGVTVTAPIRWEDCLKQTPEWYRSEEAARVADNVVSYQRELGGWPKNIDMAVALTEKDRTSLARQKQEDDATIDNG